MGFLKTEGEQKIMFNINKDVYYIDIRTDWTLCTQ